MTHLTESRDALAKALREIPVVWETETHKAVKFLLDHDDAEFVADALIASGAVIDASTLADDEALRFTEQDIENANEAMQEGEWQWFQWLLREKVRALAAALTERSQS